MEIKVDHQEKEIGENEPLVVFYFKPNQERGEFSVNFFQEDCLVKKEKGGNVLGKTEEEKVRFYSPVSSNK